MVHVAILLTVISRRITSSDAGTAAISAGVAGYIKKRNKKR